MPQIDRERLKDEYSRLTTMIPLLQWGVDFVDLKDCSPKNQQSFKDAWKASKIIMPIIIASYYIIYRLYNMEV